MGEGGKIDTSELDWIALQSDLSDGRLQVETAAQKFKRKFKENPFVPIGCGLTAIALGYGLFQFKQGDRQKSQLMMRVRVGFQGLTIAALMYGVVKSMK